MLKALKPYSKESGGPLTVEHVWYHEGRGNVIIGYTPDGAEGTVAFIGSHLDVVPANPETWERNPFKLVVEVQNITFTFLLIFFTILIMYLPLVHLRVTSCMAVVLQTVSVMLHSSLSFSLN